MNKVFRVELNFNGPTLSQQEKCCVDFENRLKEMISKFQCDYGSKPDIKYSYFLLLKEHK